MGIPLDQQIFHETRHTGGTRAGLNSFAWMNKFFKYNSDLRKVARPAGLEPATSRLEVLCSRLADLRTTPQIRSFEIGYLIDPTRNPSRAPTSPGSQTVRDFASHGS